MIQTVNLIIQGVEIHNMIILVQHTLVIVVVTIGDQYLQVREILVVVQTMKVLVLQDKVLEQEHLVHQQAVVSLKELKY